MYVNIVVVVVEIISKIMSILCREIILWELLSISKAAWNWKCINTLHNTYIYYSKCISIFTMNEVVVISPPPQSGEESGSEDKLILLSEKHLDTHARYRSPHPTDEEEQSGTAGRGEEIN